MTKNGFSASTLYRLRKNFTGVCGYLVMNCAMVRCAFAVVVGLVAVRFPVAAQQANLRGTIQKDPTFTLSLYEPKIFSASERSVLFHKGPVRAWSDGGRLASENALAEIGMRICPRMLPGSRRQREEALLLILRAGISELAARICPA